MVNKLLEIAGLIIPPNDISVSGFVFNNIKDWFSGPTGETLNEQRDSTDGYFDEDDIDYNGILVSFEGVCVDPDPVSLARKRNMFSGLRNGGKNVPVSYTDPSGKTTRYGKVISTPIKHSKHLDSFEWAIDIECADPFRYGPTKTDSTGAPSPQGGITWPLTWPLTWQGGGNAGRVTLVNEGTAPAFPRMRVLGGMSEGVSLIRVGTGEELYLPRPIADGSTIYFDSSSETVTADGLTNNITRSLILDQWWSVGPGESMTIQFVPKGTLTGTPTLFVDLDPTYY